MIRARSPILCAALIAFTAMRAPNTAYAADAPLVASPPSTTPGTTPAASAAVVPPARVIDPTMFVLEGDGEGGPAKSPAAAPPAPTPHTPSWRQTGSWGWLVALTSLGLGIATTAYGLTLRCADADTQCRKNTALAIWGGVGIAAVGCTFGILIVQMGQARVNAKPAIFAGDWRSYREASARPLVPGLVLDARF